MHYARIWIAFIRNCMFVYLKKNTSKLILIIHIILSKRKLHVIILDVALNTWTIRMRDNIYKERDIIVANKYKK